jgi:hypothetical protein
MYKKAEPKIETKISYKLKIFAKNNGNILVNFLNAYLFFLQNIEKKKKAIFLKFKKSLWTTQFAMLLTQLLSRQ